jgi:hypothetical protein
VLVVRLRDEVGRSQIDEEPDVEREHVTERILRDRDRGADERTD